MKNILVLGGGFAGLWSAIGAARKRSELGIGSEEIGITLIDRNAYHGIRVRNYENDLTGITIPFADVLDPVGVEHLAATVSAIDHGRQVVEIATAAGARQLAYDRLVLALGSELNRPPIHGLLAHAFDIDTYAAAVRLDAHLTALAGESPSEARSTVLVVGAGLTGIELATELPAKLDRLFGHSRVILADHSTHIGSNMGRHAAPIIGEALAALGVEPRIDVAVSRIEPAGATTASGEFIPSATVVWCAGMHASPLTASISVERDRFGRVPVDECMRVRGVPNLFAAGDCAWSPIDGTHASVMSCQHGRPMGRFAGHNVVADLLGQPMLPLRIEWYTTILDLGRWGALYTAGWDREVLSQGEPAKQTKQLINCRRIYPPLTRDRDELLAAAAPVVANPPQRFPDQVAPVISRSVRGPRAGRA